MALPDLYQSTALVMIERQQVPEAFVRPTVTSAARDSAADDQSGDPEPVPAREPDPAVRALSRSADARIERAGGGPAPDRHPSRAEVERQQPDRRQHDRVRPVVPRARSPDRGAGDQHAGRLLHRGEPQGPRAPGDGHRRVPPRPARRGQEAARRAGGAGERAAPPLSRASFPSRCRATWPRWSPSPSSSGSTATTRCASPSAGTSSRPRSSRCARCPETRPTRCGWPGSSGS